MKKNESNKIFPVMIAVISIFIFVALSCNQDGGPGPLDKDVYRNLKSTLRVHPRLLLTQEKIESLKSDVESSHKWLWKRFMEDLPEISSSTSKMKESIGRGDANRISDIAFAAVMTDNDSLVTIAKDYLYQMSQREVWDPTHSLLEGHMLLNVALGYDWLYDKLNRKELDEIGKRLGEEAEDAYILMTDKREWFRDQYLQNHAHVHFAGLAYAAVALYGHDARAQKWLDLCINFFDHTFALSNPDGGSIEGLSYGTYGLEYCTFYTELARTVLGLDYYADSGWLKNFPQYILHSMLPERSEDEWAVSFGDNPRHANYHGPEPQLFLLASIYKDKEAEWLAEGLINLRDKGVGSATYRALLWYDPSVPKATLSSFPTMHHLNDIDQVVYRSSWNREDALLMAVKCGPFMGVARGNDYDYDLGAAHGHPDAGSFQIVRHGVFLTVDPMYTYYKRAENHNVYRIKGIGQLGEDETWFGTGEALYYKHSPRIIESGQKDGYSYILADMKGAYHPHLGLNKLLRHFIILDEDKILLIDEIDLNDKGVVYNYPAGQFTLSGELQLNEDYPTGLQGDAAIVFHGTPGKYDVAFTYIDNSPLAGSYSLLVDGSVVNEWQNREDTTDTHYEVTKDVELRDSSSVVIRANPMGPDTRLVKLTISSPDIPAARKVDWLCHFEPRAALKMVSSMVTAVVDSVTMDVYPVAPQMRNVEFEKYVVPKGRGLKETMRMTVSPQMYKNSEVVMTLFHIRKNDIPDQLKWVSGNVVEDKAHLIWYEGQRKYSLDFDLQSRKLSVVNP